MKEEKTMKILMLNGSPKKDGNTAFALKEMKKILEEEGAEVEILEIGSGSYHGCTACNGCGKAGQCVIDDGLNEAAKKFEEADGLVIGSPVYYSMPNGTLASFLQRLFYSTRFDKRMKVGCCVVADRRGGASSTFDALNKYFTISEMPVASSGYWNIIYGTKPGDAEQDLEGVYTIRTLARNMAFLIKAVKLGKETYGLPEREERRSMSFIR